MYAFLMAAALSSGVIQSWSMLGTGLLKLLLAFLPMILLAVTLWVKSRLTAGKSADNVVAFRTGDEDES